MADQGPQAEPTAQATEPPRLALRPKEAAAALGIGRRLLWAMTNAGEIPSAKIGRCTVYPVDALRRWLDERSGGRS